MKNKLTLSIIVKKGKKTLKHFDRVCMDAADEAQKTLLKIVHDNSNTEYGKKYHFSEIKTVEDYQKNVPLSQYADYAPFIKRMVNQDEKNLITSYEIKHYAVSSGSVGVPKMIPVSTYELDKYSKYSFPIILAIINEHFKNTSKHGVPAGRGLNTMEFKQDKTPFNISKGPISGTTLPQLKKILPYFLTSPWDVICVNQIMDMKYLKLLFAMKDRNLSFLAGAYMTALSDLTEYMITNWELLCNDIEHGCIDSNVNIPDALKVKFNKMLKPDPKRAEELRRIFEQGFQTPIIPRVWPNIRYVLANGTSGFAPQKRKMLKYLGKNIVMHNGPYAASESLFAISRHVFDESFVLIPDGGFYEFRPVSQDLEDTKLLTMDQLVIGQEYELIVTNLSGLYRYQMKDVIRVEGYYYGAPMIKFCYRTSQMIDIAGEKTNAEAMLWTIEAAEKITGIKILEYSVFADIETVPSRYTIFIEPEEEITKAQASKLRDVLDAKLGQANPSYGAKVNSNIFAPLNLVVVEKETYQLYRELQIYKGASSEQLKPVRIIDNPIKEKFFKGLEQK